MKHRIPLILLLLFLAAPSIRAQTWADSLDIYAREKYMPPAKFRWTWMKASLLFTMTKQYDHSAPDQKAVYLGYIKACMDRFVKKAGAKNPNGVASALGLAFLYRVTGEEKYKQACENIYAGYLLIKRTPDGGVSHLRGDLQLWDDTIFMVGEFLLEMYKATGDEKYLDELVKQVLVHRNYLKDDAWGLWVHGWDSDKKSHCHFCGDLRWPDKTTGRSQEIWGRGNGWIVVTLAEALQAVPKEDPKWEQLAGYLKEMTTRLPEVQDQISGHWYQLSVKPGVPGNFIESSCTAMFAYGISIALQYGVLNGAAYEKSVALAYNGLRAHSIQPLGNGYLTTKNVCMGTCIGDQDYYLKRPVKDEKPYSIGMSILFGRQFLKAHPDHEK
jgi:unsaturated rhamnogalacturonyl hydrolase